jgi:hypothetical protein
MLHKSLMVLPPLMLALAASVNATDDDADANKNHKVRPVRVETALRALEEVPVVSSLGASGRFKATLDEENMTITYELSYQDLEGTPLAGHVHVGQPGVNGAIPLFLCANAPALPPATTPAVQACPPAPATITGVLTPENIIPRPAQGIDAVSPEDFIELIRLMRSGAMYANVHTTKYLGGEIRGQIRRNLFQNLKDLKDLQDRKDD